MSVKVQVVIGAEDKRLDMIRDSAVLEEGCHRSDQLGLPLSAAKPLPAPALAARSGPAGQRLCDHAVQLRSEWRSPAEGGGDHGSRREVRLGGTRSSVIY